MFLIAFFLFLKLPVETFNNIFGTSIPYETDVVVINKISDDQPTITAGHEISAEKNPNEFNIQRISAYNPVPRQTDDDPNISSCGPNKPNQIAVSRDLFFDENGRKHLCGKAVTIMTDRGEVFEDYIIWDTMNPRYSNTVDIMIPSEDESLAFSFGITTGVMIIHE